MYWSHFLNKDTFENKFNNVPNDSNTENVFFFVLNFHFVYY